MIERSKLRQYINPCLAVISASLASISNGFEFGWASPAIRIFFSDDTPINPPPDPGNQIDVSNWIATMYLVGGIVGLVQTFLLLTYFGPKLTILIDTSIGLICWIFIGFLTSLEWIYVVRFICGAAACGMYVSIPMYNAECSQPEIRGLLGSIVYIFSMLGITLAYSIVPFIPIWVSCCLPICLNLVTVLTFFFQPESPYFLLKHSKTKEAEKSLQHFRSQKNVSQELLELTAAVNRQEAEKSKPWDLVRIKSNRKATLYMLLLNSTQNMAGFSAITMNAHYLLEEAAKLAGGESPLSEELSAVLFSVVMLVGGIIGSVLIDKFGRKILVVSSGICTAIFLILLTLYYAFPATFISANVTWIPLLALIGYAFAFKWGIGLVPIVVNGEIFPSSIKVTGMLISDVYFTSIATISVQIYYLTVKNVGLYVPFLIFAAYSTIAAILVWIFVPETNGKTLEEIQMILKQ